MRKNAISEYLVVGNELVMFATCKQHKLTTVGPHSLFIKMKIFVVKLKYKVVRLG
jgi:hypothetical protein